VVLEGSGNRRGRGVTRSGDGYFGGYAEGWGGLGGEWESEGEDEEDEEDEEEERGAI
jgi:hypothetical protein